MPGTTVDLPYSKGQYKRLLIQEGRWREAMAFREKWKEDHPEEDAVVAWKLMMEKYPPSEGRSVDKTAPVAPRETAEDRPASKQSQAKGAPVFSRDRGDKALKADIREAAIWVFNTMDVDVQPDDAPTTGAWSLRSWARSHAANTSEFYRSMVSKLLPSRSELNIENRFRDDGGKLENTIATLLLKSAEAAAAPDTVEEDPNCYE